MAPRSPKGPPEEEAYRAYLRSVKEYWTNLDVEALDLKARTAVPPGTLGTMFCQVPCIASLACMGTGFTEHGGGGREDR